METPDGPNPGQSPYPPSPAYQAAGPQYQPPQPSYPLPSAQGAPQSEKKGLSIGARWAIGIVVVLILLFIGSCVWMSALFSSDDIGSLTSGNGIALIHIDDAIAGTGGYVTPENILDQINQALDDPNVKSILLRIDSPGGTVAASQEISMAVKRAAGQKPVVASIGDIGASGAYMVASQCTEIVAAPGSSVGSIGVIMQIPNVESLLETVGVEFTTLTTGEFKDTGSAYRSVTLTEATMLEGQMQAVYEQFIADVAEGRGMTEAEVRELATGWVWLGAEAQTIGLVDTLGNYDDAVGRAAALGNIEGEPVIVDYGWTDPFADILGSIWGLTASALGSEAGSRAPQTLMR